MRRFICLTLLAFIAGAVLFVGAAHTRRRVRRVPESTPDPEEYDDTAEDCRLPEHQNCSYRWGCNCMPPLLGYMRHRRFFYSPRNNTCYLSLINLQDGCNSFVTRKDCWNSCVRRKPKPKPTKYMGI
uniref:Putative secreted protein n=1 Tax=Amblyomma parvum TaxID=251391 RepID=A0A023FVT4_AMBPA